jgi:F0F1-type ATP synthase epsilon subunit
MSDKKPIKVRVRDTENTLFEGDVDRISSFNEVGPFDIYPMHANFISILRQALTLYHKKEKLKEVAFEQAVMKVKKDEVHIFLGIEAFMLEEEDQIPKENPKGKNKE